MHGQLGKADVHAGHREVGCGDIAQGGAAGQVCPVAVPLHTDSRLPAHLQKDRAGHCVRGVFLIGVVFDHHAAVDHRVFVLVRIFRMRRMQGMGIVRGNQEAVCRQLRQLPAHSLADAPRHVLQKGGVGSLAAAAAHLLMVKETEQRHGGSLLRLQESLEAAEGALQIVQPGTAHQLFLRSQQRRRRSGIEEQVRCHHVFRGNSKGTGHDFCKVLRLFTT